MTPHLKYLWYVLKHKFYVLLASWHYGCLWRGLVHDLSKFRPSEWFPYVAKFYGPKLAPWDPDLPPGTRCKEDVDRDFDLAWLLHQHRNPHHWNYWVLFGDGGTYVAMEMPDIYVREMVADWTGAGRAITGKIEVVDWYRKNENNIVLHPASRRLVHDLLGIKNPEPLPPRKP